MDWCFTPEMKVEFVKCKAALTSPSNLTPFDSRMETRLLCDASRLFGFGFILLQRKPGSTDRFGIIRCGSCSLTPAQKNYSVIELEAVAINYGILKSFSPWMSEF